MHCTAQRQSWQHFDYIERKFDVGTGAGFVFKFTGK